MKKIFLESIDSTNLYLKSNYQKLDHLTWVSARYQTMGKGTKKRVWFGNEDSLMCSVLIKRHIDFKDMKLIPLLAVKSLHTVLSKHLKGIMIKWPNDLLVNNKKVSGILVESIIEDKSVHALVIGFGVNINQNHFPDEIKNIATSLKLETKNHYDIDEIHFDLMDQFKEDFDHFKNNKIDVIDYSNQYSALKDKSISWMRNDKLMTGRAVKIDDDGSLIVNLHDELISMTSDEITIIK